MANVERVRYPAAVPLPHPEHPHDSGGFAPGRVLKFHAPEIVFGIDSMAEAAHAALRLGALRPHARHRPRADRGGLGRRDASAICEQGVDARVWSDLTPNPKDHEIAAGHEVYRRTAAMCWSPSAADR